MDQFAGKTIVRIEESPTDPQYGHTSDDTLLLHFTDGTAMRIEGHSYEEVSLSFDVESATDLHARRRAAMGRREAARLKRLRREEWLSISCEERAARNAAGRARANADVLAALHMREAMENLYIDHDRLFPGVGPQTVRLRCPNCAERRCENAPTKTYPAVDDVRGWGAMSTIPIAKS